MSTGLGRTIEVVSGRRKTQVLVAIDRADRPPTPRAWLAPRAMPPVNWALLAEVTPRKDRVKAAPGAVKVCTSLVTPPSDAAAVAIVAVAGAVTVAVKATTLTPARALLKTMLNGPPAAPNTNTLPLSKGM